MTTVYTPLLPKNTHLTTIYDARSEQYTGSIAASELHVSGVSIIATSLASTSWLRGHASTPVGLAKILLVVINTLAWIIRLSRRFRFYLSTLLCTLIPIRPNHSAGAISSQHTHHAQTSSPAAQHHASDRLRHSALEMQVHSQARTIDTLEKDCRQTSIYLSTVLQQGQAMTIALQEAKAENERYRDEAARYEHLWRMEVQQHAESKRKSVTAAAASKHSRSTSLSMVSESRKVVNLGPGACVDSSAYSAPSGMRPMPQRRESMPLASKRISGRFKYLTLQTGLEEEGEVAAAPRTA